MKASRTTLIIAIVFGFTHFSFAQDTSKIVIYNPDADAETELMNAITVAGKENKHVFIQIGGNWCPWCIRFHNFCESDNAIDSILKADYVVLKINYSRENKNKEVLTKLNFPQRFGFPVFVILDGSGNRIHTQDSGLLENNKSYDSRKVATFLKNWSPDALSPEQYE
ncbi:MAG: thioredoxin family protein [Bacteroidota bacterium]